MCDFSKIWVYEKYNNPKTKNIQICPHCVWLEQAWEKCDFFRGEKQYIPMMNKPEKKYIFSDTSGVTIFNSTNKFINTHIIVNGLKGVSKFTKHNQDFSNIIFGVAQWVTYLHSLGIRNVYMMMNSHYDPVRGEKEHLHSFVSVYPEDSIGNAIFTSIFKKRYSTQPLKRISIGPYPTDKLVYDITPEQASTLIRQPDTISYLSSILGVVIGPKTSFYLFLYFNMINTPDGKDLPMVSGKISIMI